jgi:O-antigen/teichoic acid export membrane protein
VSEPPRTAAADTAIAERELVRSAGWMVGSHVLAQTFAYGSLILLARWLSPASFGTLAVGTAVVYVAVLFVDQGALGGIIVRQRLTRADLVGAFRRCLLTATVLAGVMAATAGLVVDRFASGGDAAAVAALALCLPLHAVAVVPTALLQKSMQFRRLAGLNASTNAVSAAVAVVLALTGFGVWSLVARQLVVFALLAVLTPVLCRGAWREHRMASPGSATPERAPNGERWFFLFGVTLMITANLDYLVIGGTGDATLVGLYALAFTIAMTPSTHISEQLGKVLFAASALAPENSSRRTEQSVRWMAMLFLPLLPAGVLLAPTVLPAVLGEQWQPMVVPFQLLLVVGVGQAIVNCIGEALSGNGHIEFRAKVMVARCGATLAALVVLVSIDGIRGAAFAQLLVFVPYAALYATAGARRAGTSAGALWLRLRPVAALLAAQLAVTGTAFAALSASGRTHSVAVCAAAVVGLVVCAPLLIRLALRERRA